VIIAQLIGYSSKTEAQEKERETRIATSPHYQSGKFVNPNGISSSLFSWEVWKVTKEYVFGKRVDPKPLVDLSIHPLNHEQWEDHTAEEFTFSWLGHSAILISIENQLVIVDPVLGERASPVSWAGPQRFHPAPVKAVELPEIDVVLISHDHYDHLEKETLVTISEKVKRFVVPLGIGTLLDDWGIETAKIVELDWGERYSSGLLEFHATPAVHYSGRGLLDGNQRLWSSWAIIGKERRVFISGDSGYYDGFKEIGERLGPFDATFLKIGAYSDKGTWRALHMTPEEAGQQHMDLGGRLMIPLHWATFDMALHPWYEPIERLVTFAGQNSITLVTPEVGAKIDLRSSPNTNRWWLEYIDKD